MAWLGPQEILWIVILVVLLLWGPKQIPKLARSLGLARREFERASRGEVEEVEEEEDEITKLAKELGIDTKGKSKEEIIREIVERTKKR
ncbi:twin-arginine translocase TatA/TatE family subunit [Candidatus Geothermarchaeota archaeon ex4572_27]|nr:MAG: twin-arginine translocase TatA/TatE family subunit [Candidatus Geothermarchaeota archaeon ex4572_27]